MGQSGRFCQLSATRFRSSVRTRSLTEDVRPAGQRARPHVRPTSLVARGVDAVRGDGGDPGQAELVIGGQVGGELHAAGLIAVVPATVGGGEADSAGAR